MRILGVGLVASFAVVLVACPKPATDNADASVAVATASAPAVVDAAPPPPAADTVNAEWNPLLDAGHHHTPPVDAGKAKAPPTSKAAPASTCKGDDVDNGEGCFKRCEADKDCPKPKKCMQMMVPNPNGGTSMAMSCQTP